jgi:small subunit ribosomal protein S24e
MGGALIIAVLYSQILMRFVFALRYRRSLMPLDPSKRSFFASSPLKRPYANQATASVPKHYEADVNHSRSPSPPPSSERRPAKAPKLTGDYPSMSAMSASSRGMQRPTVSSAFEMPSSSSSKSRGSLASRISGSPSQKDSSKRGKGRGKGKGKEHSLRAAFPVLDGPLRDAAFTEQEHRKNLGARPDIKPGLVDNPKSPVANFASHHLDKQPTYEAVEGVVSGTSERVYRFATFFNMLRACAYICYAG